MYGDPTHLRSLARRLQECATQVRSFADEVVARAAATRWQSTAADAMRRRVAEEAAAIRHAAALLEQAAEAVRHHADVVELRVQEIARIERAAMHLLGSLVAQARAMLTSTAEPADGRPTTALRGVPWPAAGSREWLSVPGELARRGLDLAA